MFKKETSHDKPKNVETIIGPAIKVKGNFNGQGDIVIEGQVEGSLKTNGDIFISEKAKIAANIEAKCIKINGQIDGNVFAKKYLAIGSQARIFGDVQYGEISIERGAVISGNCVMADEEKPKREEKPTKKEETK
jgi:cytoskeletal protein CcmA (bactofilin family)